MGTPNPAFIRVQAKASEPPARVRGGLASGHGHAEGRLAWKVGSALLDPFTGDTRHDP